MKQLGVAVSITFLLSLFAVTLRSQDRQEYIRRYKDISISEMHRAGVPASIKLAQGILESNAGASMLAVKANNHFGIKCGNDWKGKAMHKQDDDRTPDGRLVKSCFRWFDSAEESFVAHSEFIRDPNKDHRYGFLFELDIMDYRAWAHGLKRAGYATNPDYPKLLIRIIEQYGLASIDAEAMQILADGGNRTKSSNKPTSTLDEDVHAYPREYHNKVETVVAYDGDSPATIAARLDIKVKKIVKYNATVTGPSDTFEAGERVYLEKKKNRYKGDQKYHMVDAGETLEEISDRYGVKLKTLYKRNGIPEGAVPAPGQRISIKGKNAFEVSLKGPEPEGSSGRDLPKAPEELIQKTVETTQIDTGSATPATPPLVQPVYVVQPKDTLYQIARRHGMDVTTLKKINNLSGDLIKPGQVLKLQE